MACLWRNIANYAISHYDNVKYAAHRENPRLVKFMKWRRYMLAFLIIPCVFGDAVWTGYNETVSIIHRLSDDPIPGTEAQVYDIMTSVVITSAMIIQFILCVFALFYHHNWNVSSRHITWAFFVPYTMTFLLYMPPVAYIMKSTIQDLIKEYAGDISDEYEQYIESIATLALSMYYVYYMISHLAPSSISIIPAIIRGAIVVRQITSVETEMDIIIQYFPVILLPILTLFFITIIQITGSCFIMGAYVALVMAILTRNYIRRGFLCTAILCITLYLTHVSPDGIDIVREELLEIGWQSACKFLLEFIIKYNILTIITSDYLLHFMAQLYTNNKAKRARNIVEMDLSSLCRKDTVNLAVFDNENDIEALIPMTSNIAQEYGSLA